MGTMSRWMMGYALIAAVGACTYEGGAYGDGVSPSGSGVQPDPTTRIAIENTSSTEVLVTLDDGELLLEFAAVPPGTATDYEDADDMGLDLEVVVDAGTALGGVIELTEGRLNLIVLADDVPPTVETLSSSSSGAGGGTVGDPGAGNGGW